MNKNINLSVAPVGDKWLVKLSKGEKTYLKTVDHYPNKELIGDLLLDFLKKNI